MVVASNAKAVKARVDWLKESERQTLSHDAPRGAINLHVKLKDALAGYPFGEPKNPALLDGPVLDTRRPDEDEVGGAWVAGMVGTLMGEAELDAAVSREGDVIVLKAHLNGLPGIARLPLGPALTVLARELTFGMPVAHDPRTAVERDRPRPMRRMRPEPAPEPHTLPD
jgi:hypothetical protein